MPKNAVVEALSELLSPIFAGTFIIISLLATKSFHQASSLYSMIDLECKNVGVVKVINM